MPAMNFTKRTILRGLVFAAILALVIGAIHSYGWPALVFVMIAGIAAGGGVKLMLGRKKKPPGQD
jgi:type III secretory pathway component EscV